MFTGSQLLQSPSKDTLVFETFHYISENSDTTDNVGLSPETIALSDQLKATPTFELVNSSDVKALKRFDGFATITANVVRKNPNTNNVNCYWYTFAQTKTTGDWVLLAGSLKTQSLCASAPEEFANVEYTIPLSLAAGETIRWMHAASHDNLGFCIRALANNNVPGAPSSPSASVKFFGLSPN